MKRLKYEIRYLSLSQLIIDNSYRFSALTTGFYLGNKPSIICGACNKKVFSLTKISNSFKFSTQGVVPVHVRCIYCNNNLELWYTDDSKNIASPVKTVTI